MSFAFKADMSKANDRVKWEFLHCVMMKMGFNEIWRGWVKECLSSVSYQVLVNWFPSRKFSPTRGLRQGDPLSPYLFILCAEGLHALLKKAEERRLIHGISVCRRSPAVSHLFFADDCLIFIKGGLNSAGHLKSILLAYERASGQKIIFTKSALCCNPTMAASLKADILDILQVKVIDNFDKYLDLPTFVGKDKRKVFGVIRERVWNKIKGWENFKFSKGSKEILMKAVLQALPCYFMGVFKIPQALCDDLNSLIANF